jgi:hypothetical protein
MGLGALSMKKQFLNAPIKFSKILKAESISDNRNYTQKVIE